MSRPRRDGEPPQPVNRRRLTDLFVRKLQPRSNTFRVWDSISNLLLAQD